MPGIGSYYARKICDYGRRLGGYNELKRHPYINYYQAKAIVEQRRLSGPIHDLQELHLLRDFPPEAIARLQPYMDYTE